MGQLLKLKKAIQEVFEVKNIDESDLDWIFVHVLKINRTELKIDRALSVSEIKQIYKLAKLRMSSVPLSQVLGYVDFYGLNIKVCKNVLSPRPETELLVEEVLKDFKNSYGLDVGTGSGAIAITLNKFGNNFMTAVDVSGKALKVAQKNAKNLGANVTFVKSDLFKNIKSKFDFIVSNPPYIKKSDIKTLDKEVREHEPILALCGGESGYEFYEKIIKSAPEYLNEKGKIYFELGIGQANYVKSLLEKDFCDIQIICDYNKIERIIKATKK